MLEGRGLSARDSDGMSDAYCDVFVGDRYWRTSVQESTLNPYWGETGTFDLSSPSELVHLVLFDWNRMLAHVFMGEVAITLADLLPAAVHGPVERWVELQQPASRDEGVS